MTILSEAPPKLATEIVTAHNLGSFMVLCGDSVGASLKEGAVWEPEFTTLVERCVSAKDHVIDVGAYIGLNTSVLANAVGTTGVVVAIEPLRIFFQQLCGNCFLNGLANVLTLHAAVGAAPGITELEPVNYFSSSSDFSRSAIGLGGERVQRITLDSLGLPKVSFINIDAQGSEVAIIEGARQLLFTARPVVYVRSEPSLLEKQGSSRKELLDLLRSLGYLVLQVENTIPSYLCLPVERREELA